MLKNAGVNRLSFGVQTFEDELLQKIGRVHKQKDVFRFRGKFYESVRRLQHPVNGIHQFFQLDGRERCRRASRFQ
jgi:hypothetical protein